MKQKYVEPKDYFTPEMLKAAKDYDALRELAKNDESSKESPKKKDDKNES